MESMVARTRIKERRLIPALSAAPAAPVCPASVDNAVRVSVNPDIPSPRCVIASPGQPLEVTNNTKQPFDAWFGDNRAGLVTVAPGETASLSVIPHDALDYGVHKLETTGAAGPAVWILPPVVPDKLLE